MDVNIESSSISQCLNFDDMSWDDEEDDTSQSDTCAALESSNNSGKTVFYIISLFVKILDHK